MSWTTDDTLRRRVLQWGKGYSGEDYWREEEAALLALAEGKSVRRICSAGCGLFRELGTLRQIAREEVVGVDMERQWIEELRPQVALLRHPSVSVICADFPALRAEEAGCFDWVLILFGTLGVVEDAEAFARRAWELAAPGGRLIISNWRDEPQAMQRRMQVYTEREGKTATVQYNAAHSRDEVVVYNKDTEVFRSGVLTRPMLESLAQRLSPSSAFSFIENAISRILVIEKRPL